MEWQRKVMEALLRAIFLYEGTVSQGYGIENVNVMDGTACVNLERCSLERTHSNGKVMQL